MMLRTIVFRVSNPKAAAAALARAWVVLLMGAMAASAAQTEAAPDLEPSLLESVNVQDAIGDPAGPPLEGEALLTELDAIASLMRCPVCQGLSVADSPVAAAIAMREEVRSLLKAGYSRDQIFDYFEGAYGEFIRLSPRARGFNLLVWIAPVVMLLVGAWLVWTRTRRRSDSAEEVVADEGLEAYRDRVRREVGYEH